MKITQFIYKKNCDTCFLFVSLVFNLFEGNHKITKKPGTQDASRTLRSWDLFRKPFLWRSRVTTGKNVYTLSYFEIALLIPTIPFAICQANENSF